METYRQRYLLKKGIFSLRNVIPPNCYMVSGAHVKFRVMKLLHVENDYCLKLDCERILGVSNDGERT